MQQIIKPIEIDEIYKLVDPEGETQKPYFMKMRAISLFINNKYEQVLKDFEYFINEIDDEELFDPFVYGNENNFKKESEEHKIINDDKDGFIEHIENNDEFIKLSREIYTIQDHIDLLYDKDVLDNDEKKRLHALKVKLGRKKKKLKSL